MHLAQNHGHEQITIDQIDDVFLNQFLPHIIDPVNVAIFLITIAVVGFCKDFIAHKTNRQRRIIVRLVAFVVAASLSLAWHGFYLMPALVLGTSTPMVYKVFRWAMNKYLPGVDVPKFDPGDTTIFKAEKRDE